jgi:hypothetical protein
VKALVPKEYARFPDGATTISVVSHVTENPGVATPSNNIRRIAS